MSNEYKDWKEEYQSYYDDILADWMLFNQEGDIEGLPHLPLTDWLINRMYHAKVPAKIKDDPAQEPQDTRS